jgi:hypothetical protein
MDDGRRTTNIRVGWAERSRSRCWMTKPTPCLDGGWLRNEPYSSFSEKPIRPSLWPTLALAAAALGCHDPLSSDTLPTGTYALGLVDGAALPFRGQSSTTLRGQLVLGTQAKYTITQTDSAHAGGALSQFQSDGTWALNENALVLHQNGSTPIYLGVVAPADTVRVILDAHTNTYLKR